MAAGQGFKTFVTGEVLTAGDVNGYLMQGINVFASEAARNAAITSPQEGQFAFTKDTNSTWYYDGAAWVASGASGDVTGVTAGTGITVTDPSGPVPTVTNAMATAITTNGDLIYGTGSGTFTRRGIGSTGNVLTVSGGVPVWSAPAGGGKIAQVVSTTFTNYTSTTSTSYIDITGFSATITPTNASSKIYVSVVGNFQGSYNGDNSCQYELQLVRGSTSIYEVGRNNFWEEGAPSTTKKYRSSVPLNYLDSPATTSATTYKMQMQQRFGGTVSCNEDGRSTITLMEVLP